MGICITIWKNRILNETHNRIHIGNNMLNIDNLKNYSVNSINKKLMKRGLSDADRAILEEYRDSLKEKNTKFVDKLFKCEVYKKADRWLKDNGVAKDIRFNGKTVGKEYKINELFAAMAAISSHQTLGIDHGGIAINARKIKETLGV